MNEDLTGPGHFPPPSAVLSKFQARELLEARNAAKKTIEISLDLGISRREVRLDQAGIGTDDGPLLDWTQLQTIADSENGCFRVHDGGIAEIRAYSESTRRTFRLFPTKEAPGLLISGFTMHRFKDITPNRAALEMVRAAAPVGGRVLDTATGLGYTAIAAAKSAGTVVTIEIDPGSLEMARANPWSRALFRNPAIQLVHGDSSEEIARFPDCHFSVIIHDPPSLSLDGDLYAGSFYRQAWRVLAAKGRMFHYLGDPGSTLGGRVGKGVVQRLKAAGFSRVVAKPAAFGVLACK
jgi:predicted methyltransferase